TVYVTTTGLRPVFVQLSSVRTFEALPVAVIGVAPLKVKPPAATEILYVTAGVAVALLVSAYATPSCTSLHRDTCTIGSPTGSGDILTETSYELPRQPPPLTGVTE